MASQVQILDIITPIVSALVDSPAQIEVAVTPDDRYVIRVTPETNDVGKIIGKQGRTARAIRTILAAYAQKEKIVLSLDIVESGRVATA